MATITASASSSVVPSTVTWNGRAERSIFVIWPVRISVPNRSAWRRRSAIIWLPSTPSGYPGKFSISVVVVSCPPGSMPS